MKDVTRWLPVIKYFAKRGLSIEIEKNGWISFYEIKPIRSYRQDTKIYFASLEADTFFDLCHKNKRALCAICKDVLDKLKG